jgi:hypothetical protein
MADGRSGRLAGKLAPPYQTARSEHTRVAGLARPAYFSLKNPGGFGLNRG